MRIEERLLLVKEMNTKRKETAKDTFDQAIDIS